MKQPTLMGVHIKCANLDSSLDFYLSFGFKPIFAYGDKNWQNRFEAITTVDEKYNGVSLGIGESAVLELADDHIAVKPEVFKESVNSSKISLFFDINDVNTVEEIANENSYEIVKDITSYP